MLIIQLSILIILTCRKKNVIPLPSATSPKFDIGCILKQVSLNNINFRETHRHQDHGGVPGIVGAR